MTFRTDKRHKVQESGKADKNVLALASRLQRFLTTGKATRKDLKSIDDYFASYLKEQAQRALDLLEQLKEHVPKSKGREVLEEAISSTLKWISDLTSQGSRGYSSIQVSRIDEQGILLEEIVDSDTDLTRMLIALNSALTAALRKSSYEVPDVKEIAIGCIEILQIYESREKLLEKVSTTCEN